MRVALSLYAGIRANHYNNFVITNIIFQFIFLGSDANTDYQCLFLKKLVLILLVIITSL